MAYNPFVGWTRAELEAELEKAQDDLAAGKTTVSAGEGAVSFTKLVQTSPAKRIEILLRALNKVAPDDYPLADITRITRTVAVVGREY